ncbi:MAG: peptidyl-prolyl cis-trans isomerase, EpsD family [Methylotenera sp.]|nr:peptidyl-prolyl cis-trans isomerase, EpsD family [Methylotenera sp.]
MGRTLSIVLIAVALTACGKGGDKKASTQTVAKVDDTEITMHEVNLLLKGVPNITPENAPTMRKQVLDKLIDQQILVEKANKESLDRTPEVIMAMEAAKKEVLANAYLQKLVTSSSKINDTEVKHYFTDHPALFSNRRIYTFDDIGLGKNDAILATLKEDVAQQKTLPEIANWLKDNSVKYSSGSYTRPAEQIPLTMLPKLQDAKEGDTVIIEAGNAIHLIHIVKAENSPIDLAAATPFIKSFFVHTRGKEIVDEKMKQFRKEAKVEYVGEFAVANNAPQTAPVATATTTQVDTKAIAKEVESKANKQLSIEEGVAGLK